MLQKLHHAKKLVARALKLGRGFERQRLGKKLKASREKGDEEGIAKVERDMEVLKGVDLASVAGGMLRKVVLKKGRKVGLEMGVFWPAKEEVERALWSGEEGPDKGKLEKRRERGKEKERVKGQEEGECEEVKRVRSNVIAMLCNMKPVREALAGAVKMVREVAASKWSEDKSEPGEEEGGEEEGRQENKRRMRKEGGMDEDEEEEESTSEAEYSEWDGIQEGMADTTTLAGGSTPEKEILKSSTGTGKKKNISLIDPSRGPDDEWSGGEDEFDEENENDADDDEGYEDDSDDVEGEGDEKEDKENEEELSESELISRFDQFIAPASGDEGSEESNPESDSDSPSSPPPHPSSKKNFTFKPNPNRSKNTHPISPSPSRSPSPTPPATTKHPQKPTTSTFLPTLMGMYISGSDSDSNSNSHKRDPAQKKERKNRMGQQARRALAEKKFGDKAKHVQKGLGRAGERRGDGKGGHGRDGAREGSGAGRDESGGFGGPGTGRGGTGRGGGGGGGGGAKVASDRKKDTEGPLHPSWEAARKLKEQKAKAEFQGKKIKFE